MQVALVMLDVYGFSMMVFSIERGQVGKHLMSLVRALNKQAFGLVSELTFPLMLQSSLDSHWYG